MSVGVGFRSAVTDSRYSIERLPVAALYERRGLASVRQSQTAATTDPSPVAALYERRGLAYDRQSQTAATIHPRALPHNGSTGFVTCSKPADLKSLVFRV